MDDMMKLLRDTSREIAEVFGDALRDNQALSYVEKTMLQQCFYEYAADMIEGVDTGRDYKMTGIMDWLRRCGKIDEETDEMLSMLMNRIQKYGEDR